MDPQQRLLLECAHEALAGSSLAAKPKGPSRLMREQKAAHKQAPLATAGLSRHSDTGVVPEMGVFVGASYAEYLQLCAMARAQSTYTASGGSMSVLAGRVSYLFGFNGPCVVTDTACSSSLVALSSAHNTLMVSDCGGASALLFSQHTLRVLALR
jgi:acyl transferase domain-containing protein